MALVLQEGGRDHALALVRLTADIVDISGSSFGDFCWKLQGRGAHSKGVWGI